MKTLILMMILNLVITTSAFAGKKVAVVSMLRGQVEMMTLEKTIPLNDKDSVEDGAVIKTSDKSFVRLVFFDKSQMNVGPNSEMKIEKFTGDDSGVIDLVKGQIRSQVTKDYLQMNKDKSKLFIKTPNAVMGIRGTDFMISTNGTNTSAILFEGSVVFNKLDSRGEINSRRLEEIVDRGVRMHPGEFSVMEHSRPFPTEPALLNVQQRERLEKNESFDIDRNPSNSVKVEGGKGTVVPVGLDGNIVSNNSDILKTEVAKVASVDKTNISASSDPEGFVKGDKVKPANGSFVHVESGVIIPPGAGSVLDKNTNTYIPGSGSGSVNVDGNFVPPKNVEITPDGKVYVATTDKNGVVKVQEVPKPSPVLGTNQSTLIQLGTSTVANTMVNPAKTEVENDILNNQFNPSGLNDLSNFQRNGSGGVTADQPVTVKPTTNTRIIVKP